MTTTREKILRHANKLVMEEGLTNFTIADVAKSAGISKGGLLHHFGTKDELIRSMIAEGLQAFRERFEESALKEGKPGAWTRAYVESSFPPEDAGIMAGAPLLAGLANDRSLISKYVEEQTYWSDRIGNDGIDRMLAEMIRLAADGLFFNEAFGVKPLSESVRAEFIDYLKNLATKASA